MPGMAERVCARATLLLSGAGRALRTDSKTHAVLLLRFLRDLVLCRGGVLRADLGTCALRRQFNCVPGQYYFKELALTFLLGTIFRLVVGGGGKT